MINFFVQVYFRQYLWQFFFFFFNPLFRASLVAQWTRVCLPMQGTWVRSLVWEDSTCRRATKPVYATTTEPAGEGNGNAFQCSRLENPRDGGAWWAAVYGVAQSWTRLKQLSNWACTQEPGSCQLLKPVLCNRKATAVRSQCTETRE